MTTTRAPIGDAEIDLLLEAIYRTCHHDFRRYARPTLERRIEQAVQELCCPSVRALAERVGRDEGLLSTLLAKLTIQVSDLFRDSSYWVALRQRVLPHLSTYPWPRVWIAGCGAGEEAYSMAILLYEEGLLERTQIYATDIEPASLREAERGVYDLDRVRQFSDNYFRAGGRRSLSDYYTTGYSRAAFSPLLRKRIVFSDHSLATDSAFAEVQLISCRNVLIYFDPALQERAIGVFLDSLCTKGFLGLGSHESLHSPAQVDRFEPFVREEKIFRMRSAS